MRFLSFILLACLCFAACRNPKVNTYENNWGVEPGHLAQIDTPNFTIIRFSDSLQNFGSIKTGQQVVLHYHFRNEGHTVLFISNVQPSCGCTVVDYPRNPIFPDSAGTITAKFDSKNHPGFIHKTITVSANTANGVRHVLVLTGQVKDSL